MLPTADFSKLERAVLDMVKDLYKDPTLSAQIDAARFEKRNWTKAGYYVDLKVPDSVKKLDCGFPLGGPYLKETPEIESGGGTLIWGDNGYINCIEMYCHGDSFAEDPTRFELYVDKTDHFKIERNTTSGNP